MNPSIESSPRRAPVLMVLAVVLVTVLGARLLLDGASPDTDPGGPDVQSEVATNVDSKSGSPSTPTREGVQSPEAHESNENGGEDSPETPADTSEVATQPPTLLQFSRESRRGETPRAVQEVHVFGRVVDARGRPVVGALVFADGYAVADVGEVPEHILVSPALEHYAETQIATTDMQGRFDLRIGLPLGFDRAANASLNVWAKTSLAASEPGEVEWYADAKEAALELVVPDRGAVSGRLVAPDGTVPHNLVLRLRAQDAENTWLGNATLDEFGDFRFENLPAGPVTLSMESDLWSLEGVSALVVRAFDEQSLGDLTVQPRRVLDISLQVEKGKVTGHEFLVRFLLPDGSVEERRRKPYHGGLLRITDPPAEAVRVELSSAAFEPLESPLPKLSRRGQHEIGPFLLVPSQ